MSIQVLMPALSPTMTEGKLAKWHVKVGDAVKSGQVICEIETDKATMEVEAVDEGTVAKILVDILLFEEIQPDPDADDRLEVQLDTVPVEVQDREHQNVV